MYNHPILGLSGRWAVACLLLTGAGCLTTEEHVCDKPVPHELSQVPLPPYVIEPPDILVIDALRLVPKPPYRVTPLDVLGIQVTRTLPEKPIVGLYNVETDGTVNLGYQYGMVKIDGMTLEEAKKAIAFIDSYDPQLQRDKDKD